MILTFLEAGLALNTVGSPVKGFTPLRAFLAGDFLTTILKAPGNTNFSGPPFFKCTPMILNNSFIQYSQMSLNRYTPLRSLFPVAFLDQKLMCGEV